MEIEIREEPIEQLAAHAQIPIAFEVACILELAVRREGLGGLGLVERRLEVPYTKDHDSVEGPAQWGQQFDLSSWGLLSAWLEGQRVGGAAVAFDCEGLQMLESRRDLAVLFDIRVSPGARGRGIGSALFAAAERWAQSRGCRHLKVETQNINVPACKFYVSQGCELGAIHRFAYPDLPGEIQLLWYKELSDAGSLGTS